MSDLLIILLGIAGFLLGGAIVGATIGILWIAPRFYHFDRIAARADYVARLIIVEEYATKEIIKLAQSIYHNLLNQDFPTESWPEK